MEAQWEQTIKNSFKSRLQAKLILITRNPRLRSYSILSKLSRQLGLRKKVGVEFSIIKLSLCLLKIIGIAFMLMVLHILHKVSVQMYLMTGSQNKQNPSMSLLQVADGENHKITLRLMVDQYYQSGIMKGL